MIEVQTTRWSTSRAVRSENIAGPFQRAFAKILPSAEQSLLLAACLGRTEGAQNAWNQFAARAGDPKSYFESDRTGLKGLLPFVESSLARNGVDAGKAFHTYARVALVREELRGKIVAPILDSVLASFEKAGIRTVLLKGAALSATVYPQPSARHTHAIDLLVDGGSWKRSFEILSQLHFARGPLAAGATQHQDFRHWTGLALGLHTTAFFLPYFELPPESLRERTQLAAVDGREVRILAPEESLVHVCGHAVYSRSRRNLRWVCDAALILHAHGDFDWQRVVALSVGAGLALPLAMQLRWIDSHLIKLPPDVLADLETRAATVDRSQAESFHAALLLTTQSRRGTLAALAPDKLAQLGFLQFCVLPPARYMRWKHNATSVLRLLWHYADRPRRFARHLVFTSGSI